MKRAREGDQQISESSASLDDSLLSQLDGIRNRIERNQRILDPSSMHSSLFNQYHISEPISRNESSIEALPMMSHFDDPRDMPMLMLLSQLPSPFPPASNRNDEPPVDSSMLPSPNSSDSMNSNTANGKSTTSTIKLKHDEKQTEKPWEPPKFNLHEDYFKEFEDIVPPVEPLVARKAEESNSNLQELPAMKTPKVPNYGLPQIAKIGDTTFPTVEYIHNPKHNRTLRQKYVDVLFPLFEELFGNREMGRRASLALEREIYDFADGEAGYRHTFAHKMAMIKKQLKE